MKKSERYKLLIEARNYHYDNFNKWMTFFYVAIGAIFIGYYNIIEIEKLFFEKMVIITIGLIVSVLWYWSCKGYYYWITHYIELIKIYEKDIPVKKRLYYCFANKNNNNNYFNPLSGANISTSKVNLLFAFIVANIWNILLIKMILDKIFIGKCIYLYILVYLTGLVFLYFFISLIPTRLKSKINDFPDLTNDVY